MAALVPQTRGEQCNAKEQRRVSPLLFGLRRCRKAYYLGLRTTVVGTPIAVASRASVSNDGVWRPASTRAMFGL
jgi:hypothetical protein